MRKHNGQWLADIRPEGRDGPRVRRKFATQAEARQFEQWTTTQASTGQPWQQKETDTRQLSELVATWYELHGQTLKYSHWRKVLLEKGAAAMGNPVAARFSAADFVKYRSNRLSEGTKPATCNRELAYWSALFNELRRAKQIDYPNPLADVRRLKTDETELTYLDADQIKTLLAALDASESDAKYIARVCLATGARWSEAANLRASQVKNGRITYHGTKSGKNRAVPISEALETQIRAALPFTNGLGAFRRTVAAIGLQLPAGQMTHVLRHTFASYFVINGGNILTLQRILGHHSVTMTMRYAHLAPDHLQEALRLNPLA